MVLCANSNFNEAPQCIESGCLVAGCPTVTEVHSTLPFLPFLQAMSMFSSALASGQLGPLLSQFGLPAEAVDAANRGGEARRRGGGLSTEPKN